MAVADLYGACRITCQRILSASSTDIADYYLALLEGAIRLAIFIGYVAADLSDAGYPSGSLCITARSTSAINCIEQGLDLTVENVQEEFHGCTSAAERAFLLFVMLISSVILFLFIRVDYSDALQLLLRRGASDPGDCGDFL